MKQLLVIGHVWPEPDSSAAGSRMMQLLQFFRSRDYKVTFATTTAESKFAANLKVLGIQTAKIQLNDSSFDGFLKTLEPEMVLFDRFMTEEQFGWRVSENCPDAVKILDTEDLHFLRKAREVAFKKQLPEEDLLFTSELAKREIASIFRCDLSLIISEAEMNLLTEKFQIDSNLLHYLPFLLDDISKENVAEFPSFEERKHFISIGNFLHEPNWNSVLTLKEKIWPLIREKLPKAEMHVYGAYPSEKVFNLHNPSSGFLIKGRAENAEKAMQQARVCLAPIQFGAGLKGKLVQAMQCGTPSVTSRIGAEGINGKMKWNGFIEENPKIFAESAVKLHEDKASWQDAQHNGFEIMNTRFSKRAFEEAFAERLLELRKNLGHHRKNNFIGAMLQHHQHRSTYFMSKYIELKNKSNS